MKINYTYRVLVLLCTFVLAFILLPIIASAVDPISGISVTASSATSGPSLSNGTITITRRGGLLNSSTATITIKNTSKVTANISFTYAHSGSGSATLNGVSATSGTYSGTLAADATVTMTLKGAGGYATGTLKLSNFSWTEVSNDAKATITYDASMGSVSLGGNPVSNGGSATAVDGQLSAVATPASNYSFVGWVNLNTNELLSSSASATLNVPQNMNLHAVFVKNDGTSNAWFLVDGTKLFNDLDVAAQEASSIIVLAADGTLSADNYTIPSGVTLLIPFDDANTIYTTDHKNKGGLVEGGTSAATGAYRTLTMADGVNITVNGSINLSAKLNAPGGGKTNAGAPTGEVPYIVMQGNSSITLNSGAYLYCYGFITGSGSVLAKSGATVYECFQIRDYRGGDGSSSIKDVFPSSQYYIQNVEVPITFESGATLKGVSAINVSLIGAVYMNDVSVIGSSGSLFTNSGTVTKEYNGSIDRLIINIAGDASLGSVALDFGNWGASIDSAKFVLGLNNNMTVNVNSGTTTAKQALALQPGAILNIAYGAEVVLEKNLHVYDADEWGDYVYCEDMTTAKGGIEHPATDSMQDGNNWAAVQVAFAPGKQYTRTIADLVDAQINVNGTLTATNGLLYTTASGANITSSAGTGKVVLIAGTATITKQADMNSGSTLAYYDIPITSAKLKNGDGSYVETSSATSVTTYAYCQEHMAWVCGNSEKGVVNFATNVELGNSLNMYFAFWSDNVTITNGHKVVVSHTDWETKETKTVEFPYEKWQITDIKVSGTTKQQNAYVVYYKGMSAKQMGDVITVTLCDSSGNVVDTWSNSIQHYAMRMLSMHNDNETLRTLIVDMLNYGTACQNQFNYDTGNLVNAGLGKKQQDWATKTVNWDSVSNEKPSYEANLIVDGNIRFAFKNANDQWTYTFTNHWGTAERNGNFIENKSGETYYYINKLYVADARQTITITIGNAVFTDSIAAYCKRMIDSNQDTNGVFIAFMKFSDSAYNYLHDEVNRV